MIVAITGGTGFIGRALVSRQLEEGHTVRVLSRRPRNRTGFPDAVKMYSGDLAEAAMSDFAAFVDDADVVYHCAGEISDPARMRAVHVDGTLRLVQAATGRIGHWVQLSSVGAYGPQHSATVTEQTHPNPVGIYETTKLESDEIVQQAQGPSFPCTILRPSNVFGPQMRNQSLSQMTAVIQRGLFCFIGRQGASANYIHVDNVVEGLLRCGRSGDGSGKVYNLSDHRTLETFVTSIAGALGVPCPRLRIPEAVARLAARTFRTPRFPLTESRVNALTTRAVYATTRIERELGYRHAISMEQAIHGYVEHWKQRRKATPVEEVQ